MLPHLWIIRHGQTAWSLSGQHTGRTDLALTEQGGREARALGPALRAARFATVLCSPRRRARETCVAVGLDGVSTIDPDLAEWDYGAYEGLTSVEIRASHPGWDIYRDGCPQGETPEQVQARADRVIARVRQADGDVAVFSHGHLSRVLAMRWVALPISHAGRLTLATASLSRCAYEHDDPRAPVIALWNATPHA